MDSIHGHSYATKHPKKKSSKPKPNCENTQNTLNEIFLLSPDSSIDTCVTTKKGVIPKVKTQAYKNARFIILCDSAGLVFNEGRIEKTISTAKEQTQPVIFKHQSNENTPSRYSFQ